MGWIKILGWILFIGLIVGAFIGIAFLIYFIFIAIFLWFRGIMILYKADTSIATIVAFALTIYIFCGFSKTSTINTYVVEKAQKHLQKREKSK